MDPYEIIEIALLFLLLLMAVNPLGSYMARVYQGETTFLSGVLVPCENLLYRSCGINKEKEMGWNHYALSLLLFNLMGGMFLFAILQFQGVLPLNPQQLPAISWHLALNTATSFMTNTNWQNYSGESTASYFTQMIGLTVQNFLSAATGMVVAIALIRGIIRRKSGSIGNFWVDLTRSILYILLPLSLVFAVLLVSQGVIQNFSTYRTVQFLQAVSSDSNEHSSWQESRVHSVHNFWFGWCTECTLRKTNSILNTDSNEKPQVADSGSPITDAQGKTDMESILIREAVLPMGPVASQEAIKELGTNGGGFFNANSSHPFENPTPFSNLLEIFMILLIPGAFTCTFGRMSGNPRQGRMLLAIMLGVFFLALAGLYWAEAGGNPLVSKLGVHGLNMEGKETRFSLAGSSLFAVATTATSCGAVNTMHDSLTPLGGLIPLSMILLSEVIFGGVGTGLYTILAFVVIAVFVAGLMIGRTPEFLGKKIEVREMWMSIITVLTSGILGLVISGTAMLLPSAVASMSNPAAHGLSEVLYAFASMANNNGSAFAGLSGNTIFYNVTGAAVMFIGRFAPIVASLAMAGSLAGKKYVPPSMGTLPTDKAPFALWLTLVILIVGALTFFPALSLGPIVEHLIMSGGR